MREIKFRAWDKKNRIYYKSIWNLQWCFGGIRFAWDDYVNSDGTTMITELPTDDFILMQYTGLKDVKSVEIYEGDFLKVGDINMKEEIYTDYWGIKEVKFGKGSIMGSEWEHDIVGFWLYPFNSPQYTPNLEYNIGSEYFEVIGNIYENPELLEQS